MKKTIATVMFIFSLILLSACTGTQTPKIKNYTKSFYDYMDTYIRIDYATDDADLAAQVATDVEAILAKYHDLTNNYKAPNDTTYSPNIYEINQRIGEKIAINKDLYDVLVLSESMKELTDGYFDIGIGKLIDLWKAQISDSNGDPVYPDNTMPESAYNQTIAAADALDFSDSMISLTEESGIYYIETAGANLKLDLGAISKGYATQKLREYLIEQGLVYFMINSGTSSFVFGENMNRDTGMYHIGLEDPNNQGHPYGVVYVNNTSLTTSGDYERFVLYNGLRYHHIISPLTKMPMHYYHTMSLIADDAGVLDALSTALFSMSPETLNAWLTLHQADLGLETISYNEDGTITTHMGDTAYTINEGFVVS